MKICTRCKVAKPLDLFGKNKRKKDGKHYVCSDCMKEKMNILRSTAEGQKKANEASRKSRATPKGLLRSRMSVLRHAKTHPNGIYAKRKNDPLFKLSCNLRSLIGICIKNQGYSKKTRTAAILGCDYEFFHLYMEMQFKPGMNWDNQGEWHIDHKTPISWAKTEEEVIKLNHYTNLQPLWAVENIQKGNRYAN
jgi:hypothetical protein